MSSADKGDEDFLSVVAHELKTPLTPLKSVAQLMRMRMRKARTGEKQLDLDSFDRNLAAIERQVDRMDRLVTDLLEVTRMGRGRFELRKAPFDLAATIRSVVQRWTDATADEGRHRFELDVPQTLALTGDRDRIEQAVHGLVGNAVKFSPRGGLVRVEASECDAGICVTVADEGIGIAADEIGAMGKEAFVRGRRSHGYGGVGVGLYLARKIAEGHGGRVDLASPGEDRGTTATLVLGR